MARYPDLKVPGGILYGAKDAILTPSAHGAPMTQYGLTDEQIEGLGHMIPITAPDACAAFVRRIAEGAVNPNQSASETG